MKVLTVKVGEAVQIGEEAVIKVADKSGQRVRLVIATHHVISHLAHGIIPARFSNGISGETRYAPQAAAG